MRPSSRNTWRVSTGFRSEIPIFVFGDVMIVAVEVSCGYETPQNAFRRATRSGASTIVALRGVIFLAARACPPHRPT